MDLIASIRAINCLQAFSGLFQRIGSRAGQPGFLRLLQRRAKPQGFFLPLRGLGAHSHGISRSVNSLHFLYRANPTMIAPLSV